MSESLKRRRSVAGLPAGTAAIYGVLFTAALLMYSWAWPQAPIQEGDSPQYLVVARDLEDLRLDALHDRAPGYPLLLVLTGSVHDPHRVLFIASLILHFASIWLLAAALGSAGAGPQLLLIFGIVLLLPPFVEPAAHMMTENLAQFTLAAGTSCLLLGLAHRRNAWLAAASLAFAYAALTRPIYQVLPLVLSACLLACAWLTSRLTLGDAVKATGTLVLGSTVLLGGLSWINSVKFGYFGLVPTAGIHLSTKTMGFVERLPERYAPVREILIRERDRQLVKRGGAHTGTQAIWSARPEVMAATGLTQGELSGFLLRMNLTLIAAAPIEYLREVARSIADYWFPAAGRLASMNSSFLRWLWASLHAAVIVLFVAQIVVLVGVGIYRGAFRGRLLATGPAFDVTNLQVIAYVVAAAIVFYTMLLSCFLDIGEVRHRRPTDVLIVWRRTTGRAPSGPVRRTGESRDGSREQ
jgi:hypothetical protein